jgi:uncharacterized protein
MRGRHLIGCAALLWLGVGGGAADALAGDVADAARAGDRAVVRQLLQQGQPVDAAQIDGATALHWAVYRDDLELADLLLAAGARVEAENRVGVTPLQLAALYGSAPMIERLLQAGADPAQRGPAGETMLMLAARSGQRDAIRLLAAAGVSVDAREPQRGTTALMWAVAQGHPDAVRTLLELGADPGAQSGPAGLPRNYLAPRVNVRAVEQARERRQRAAEAGRSYEEQLAFEQRQGIDLGGQRGAFTPIGPDGEPVEQAAQEGGQAPAVTAGGGRGGRGAGAGRGGGGRGGQAQQPAQPAAAGGGQAPAQGQPTPAADDADVENDEEIIIAGLVGSGGGGLTPLIFAAREGHLEAARVLLDAGADVNQTSEYGWTPLLTAVNNRNYQLARLLIERGADVNLANRGSWTPLYLATDNRNIEGGDYPVPEPDMDHLELIRLLLEHGADPNIPARDNTLTRTIFTMQWFYEDGATPFIRAAQSSDVELLKLLLEFGADPHAVTSHGDNALTAAGGIGWVEGVTNERSREQNYETIEMLLDLGHDPNYANNEGRTALMGAALKGRSEVVQLLVDHGARLDQRDYGSRDTDKVGSAVAGHTWQAIDYADGLVRVGVQSAVEWPETAALIRQLLEERGLPVPPPKRDILSICVVALCQ